jgi:hypothetical protein
MDYANIVNGIIRSVVPAAIAFAVGRGVLPAGDYAGVIAAATALVSALWSVRSNTK